MVRIQIFPRTILMSPTNNKIFRIPPVKGNINRYVINIFKGIYEIQGFVSDFRSKSETCRAFFRCVIDP